MTLEISPEAMLALRPHLDSEELDDETLRRISEESGLTFEEVRAARDALWDNSLGQPSNAPTRSIEAIEDSDEETEEAAK